MHQLLYGKTSISDNQVTFCYDYDTEEITLYPDNSLSAFEGKDQIIGKKIGNMSGGKILYKLSVPFSNIEPFSNQIYPVEYFIENYRENCPYRKITLQFPELDYMLPSDDRIYFSHQGLFNSKPTKSVLSFRIIYAGIPIDIKFKIVTKYSFELHSRSELKTVSYVSMNFPETYDLDFVYGLYKRTRSFFCYVCNRKNIGLRSITLYGINNAKQSVSFSQKHLASPEDEKNIKKVANVNSLSSNLKDLFQLFFEKEIGASPIVDDMSMHTSFKDRDFFNLEQCLSITSTFEFYVETLLPPISSSESMEFLEEMDALLDDYIKFHRGNSNKKKRKKAKHLKELLPYSLISLEEKIKNVYKGYSSWGSLNSILSDWFGDDISYLASLAGKWRNDLAHGKREYMPDENAINAIRLVEHLNYCIVFRFAGYNDETIKDLISIILEKGICTEE